MVALLGWGTMTVDYPNGRLLWGAVGLGFALLGMILIVAVSAPNGRLIGYYLTSAAPTSFVALLSLIGSNVAGYTKKTTVAAMYLVAYCVGNIIGEPRIFACSHRYSCLALLDRIVADLTQAPRPSVVKTHHSMRLQKRQSSRAGPYALSILLSYISG